MFWVKRQIAMSAAGMQPAHEGGRMARRSGECRLILDLGPLGLGGRRKLVHML
jgi:hypothetical protein